MILVMVRKSLNHKNMAIELGSVLRSWRPLDGTKDELEEWKRRPTREEEVASFFARNPPIPRWPSSLRSKIIRTA